MSTNLSFSVPKEKAAVAFFSDWAFCAWVIIAFLFERTIGGRLSLAIFCGFSFLNMITFNYKVMGRKELSAINPYFMCYICFLLYVIWHIKYSGMVVSEITANSMFKTLCINGLFYYFLYKYLIIKDDTQGTLRMYTRLFLLCVIGFIAKAGGQIFDERVGEEIGINSNSIALVCVNCIIIISNISKEKRTLTDKIALFGFILFVLVSGSRKGIFGIIIALFVDSFLGFGIKKMKKVAIAALCVVVIYILIMNVPVFYNIMGYRVEALFSYFKGSAFDESSLEVRVSFVELGWSYILERPWFGYGLDCFRELDRAYGTYSHNNYVELLYGVGIIGTVIYYIGYLYILIGHLKLFFKKHTETKIFIIFMVVQLCLEYAYVSYYARQNIFIVIVSLAALQLAKSKLSPEEIDGVKKNR